MKKESFLAFGKEGDKTLLHGYLHVKIIRATNLQGFDNLCGLDNVCGREVLERFAPKFLSGNKGDPFVTISTDDQHLATTSTIDNDLNPVWNESFYVPVAHYTTRLKFTVNDLEFEKIHELIGETFLPAKELVKFDEDNDEQLRVGLRKVAVLSAHDSDDPRGHLEFFVEFIPKDMPIPSFQATVPGVYFKGHQGNEVKLYVNADDGDDMAPVVRYGGPDDDAKKWRPSRLWRDIYDAICDAKHFIYITGWAVDTTQSLLRGEEREEALAEGGYSPYIGELLKQKAEEGVTVNMLVWDDATSNPQIFRPVGFMGTHDEESKEFFEGSRVTFRLAPMQGDEDDGIIGGLSKLVMFTHHQKIVVLDAACKDDPDSREPLAFVGGIDLTNGRWDNRNHPLFRTLDNDHKGDAYNGCFAVDAACVGPREPWHDIHSCVRGPAALDVIANFRERWYKQAADAAEKLAHLPELGLTNPPERRSREAWTSQVLRSIDARVAVFSKKHLASFGEDNIEEIEGVEYEGRQTKTFKTSSADHFTFANDLVLWKGRYVDNSMHKGWVHHIRRARHTLYIESQYFLGSAHMWPEHKDTECGNLLAAEIMLKICEKIHQGERFAAYILVPLWPEGISKSGAVQAILQWQKLTMESMYKRIAAALKKAGRDDESPKDYLNFYALANRETEEGSTAVNPPIRASDEETLTKTRRHLIYVHSKMLIVDDAVTIIGSANINQRSLDGTRDSEIAVASYQPAYLPTESSLPHGDVHGFRLHCWATVTNKMENVFKHPSSLRCVRRLNAIAEENWQAFIDPEVFEMDSHLIPYPIDIDDDGNVTARPVFEGNFPDTQAPITGTLSRTLPEILTT